MSSTSNQSPLGVNVVSSLLQSQGFTINPTAAGLMGSSTTNAAYTPGSIVNNTCLYWVTHAINAAYQHLGVQVSDATYNNLISIGTNTIPALGNSLPPTYGGEVPKVATPTFSPGSGTYSSPQSVTILTATSGASIYYTTDGSVPSSASTLYTTPVSISVDTTIKAIAEKTGYINSDIGTANYVISLPKVATPTFSPGSGTYSSTQSVTISTLTSGASIYYTTDGSVPTSASTLYTTPVSISVDTTIKAIAEEVGYINSDIGTANYVISLPGYSTRYLVVGGGGGTTPAAGGGGAGGFLDGTITLNSGTTYTITVGDGGLIGTIGNVAPNGQNSSIIGGSVSIIAIGGGGSSIGANGNDGGSGGGGGENYCVGQVLAGGAGTLGQGFSGGITPGLYDSPAGGGGGAGAAGVNGSFITGGGIGGIGLSSNIITIVQAGSASVGQQYGCAVYYAGGGGASAYGIGGGGGGQGGGGYGGYGSGGGSPGTPNTGGGAGSANGAGYNGGSGVVILSVPNASYSGTYTGTPVISVDGSNTAIIFKQSGSYTA